MTQHISQDFYERGGREGVGWEPGRKEEWMTEGGRRIPPTHPQYQPTMSSTFKCLVFKLCTAVIRTRARDAELGPERKKKKGHQESQSWNPPGNATEGNLLASTACVSECVCGLRHLTRFDLYSDKLRLQECMCGLAIHKQRGSVHEQLRTCAPLMQFWESETMSRLHRESFMSTGAWEANELCWRM